MSGEINRSTDQLLAVVATRLDSLHQDMTDLKAAQRSTAEAIAKLAVIEERQERINKAIEMAFSELKELKNDVDAVHVKIRALEVVDTSNERVVKMIDGALLGLVVVVAQFAAKAVGLI